MTPIRCLRAVLAVSLCSTVPLAVAPGDDFKVGTRAGYCGAYPHRVSTVKAHAGRLDWSRANGLVAYDRVGDDGYFDVYVMSLDGSRDACLTCGKPALIPQKNNGNPAWHPSGNIIVFQSEVAASQVTPFWSNPGRGMNNVLWATDPAGQTFTPLTELSTSDAVSGVVHPHFSADGTKLSWSEIYEGAAQTGTFFGYWRLVVADFGVGSDGRPALLNVRRFEPDVPGFYENDGFSPDGSRLLFSSNLAQPGSLQNINTDIFLLDLTTLAVTRLTTKNYNEHAQFFPDGRKILWMSNADVSSRGTDLWIMNPDGNGKERLTFLNQPGCAEYTGSPEVAADSSINAAGDKVLVYVQDQVLGDVGSMMLVELDRSF